MLKFDNLRALDKSLRGVAGEIFKNTVCAGCVKGIPRGQWQLSRKVSESHSTFSPMSDNAVVARAKCIYWDVVRHPWAPITESVKRFASSTSQNHPDKFDSLHLLESWNGVVHPFGKLRVSGPFNVHISSLNPHEHPGMDRAFVSIYAQKANEKEIWHCGDSVKTKVNVSDQGKLLSITGLKKEESKDGATPSLECVLHVPIKFGIDLEVEENCCVNVSSVESTGVKIKLDMGDCVLSNIRTGFAGVESVGGNIRCEKHITG
ncbi:protein FAM185A-like isoform X2 [Liolophura sinensis]|uniref:protein FAM185A-like isoform X2 n=1 Tax=Liolophura sinensis TaxID=3198878 RepID=UPI003158BE6D